MKKKTKEAEKTHISTKTIIIILLIVAALSLHLVIYEYKKTFKSCVEDPLNYLADALLDDVSVETVFIQITMWGKDKAVKPIIFSKNETD